MVTNLIVWNFLLIMVAGFIGIKSAHTHYQLNGSGHGRAGNYDVHRMASDG